MAELWQVRHPPRASSQSCSDRCVQTHRPLSGSLGLAQRCVVQDHSRSTAHEPKPCSLCRDFLSSPPPAMGWTRSHRPGVGVGSDPQLTSGHLQVRQESPVAPRIYARPRVTQRHLRYCHHAHHITHSSSSLSGRLTCL